ERESQKTDHIKQKNDKLMQEYQKSLNTLKKPINVPYEQETENVGGLFSKEIQETGNVVISQKDFNEFQKQIKAAQDISEEDRKSTRLNSSHVSISYAVFCLK